MLDSRALKAEFVRNGYNYKSIADLLGLSTRTLTTRMKTGDFGRDEIEILIHELQLKNPESIFFAR